MKQYSKILFPVIVLFLLSSCCKDPYVKFDYELVCSEKLLEYVTPVVTYKGNGGDPVTFKLYESDWKEQSESSSKTTVKIIINGKEQTQESKYLYWTKSAAYDDFTLVEDELTVKYELKEGVTADMLPLFFNSSHSLSANIEMRDKDENMFYRQFVNINTTIGESETVLDKADYRGFKVTNEGTIEEKEYKGNQ